MFAIFGAANGALHRSRTSPQLFEERAFIQFHGIQTMLIYRMDSRGLKI